MKDLFSRLQAKQASIGVIGLGYVGLPLACLLASKYKVIGFDINAARVGELKDGIDATREVESREQLLQPTLQFASDPAALNSCEIFIVAVPTPIDRFKRPDLGAMLAASKTVAKEMKPGAIVVYESTVYPGVTEDECRVVLERESGLKHLKDFFLGYSPERVNPGDKLHTIDKIVKVVSGSTPEVCQILADVYGSVITAGIHMASSIKTAEAAKVIENTQRDINIALVNELAIIFERMGIDTQEVLNAAGTKWNFLNFRPGLVGGHCIGVDPYYLTHIAEGLGLHPQVILSGRRINDNMGQFVAEKTLRMMLAGPKANAQDLRVGILGVTFKENVPDLRNTKVIDIVKSLEAFNVRTFMIDPVADGKEFHHEYGYNLSTWTEVPECDAFILAVKHDIIQTEFPLGRLAEKLRGNKVLVDVKGSFDRSEAEKMRLSYWRL